MKNGLIIFDLFDTLMHVTMRTHQYSILRGYLSQGANEQEKDAIKKECKRVFLTTHTSADIATSLLEAKPQLTERVLERLSSLNDGVKRTMQMLVEKEVASVRPFDDADSVLGRLSERFDLVLASNLASPFKQPFLDLGYERYFKQCLFSCDMGAVKPSERMVDAILEGRGSEQYDRSRIMFVGDKPYTDGASAQMIGVHYFKSHGRPTFLKEFAQFIMP